MKIVSGLKLENSNIAFQGITPLITPFQLKRGRLAVTKQARQTVIDGRQQIIKILSGKDSRFLAIVGPCSINDPKAAIDYAGRLARLAKQTADRLLIVMRVYFEKPRTTIGWKGLIAEPEPAVDNGFNIKKGLKIARGLLLEINKMGLPVATEFLDPIIPQYISDLISWGAVGARTTESQIHRQMTSGLSMPIGFKNSTEGNIQIAANAIIAARTPHVFLGINGSGRVSVIHTKGNQWAHLVLRGGKKPNYDSVNIGKAIEILNEADRKSGKKSYDTKILIDCSHGNSGKDPVKQVVICRKIVAQFIAGNKRIAGFMLESNINPGRQDISPRMKYGVSITDPCIGWEETEDILLEIHGCLKNS
ncbi:MAG: 3-deoxy-7-phosphoheptulonate synthase [Patescibacteria group bacterium]